MILPDPSPLTAPFWEAASRHKLVMHYCDTCGTWLHPQISICPCGSHLLAWREVSGQASLISYAVTRRTMLQDQVDVPYTLLLVRLLEGPQLVSALPGDRYELHCGMPLVVHFEDIVGEGRVWSLPRFIPLPQRTEERICG